MKKFLMYLPAVRAVFLIFLVLNLSSCDDYGKKLEFNKGEVYYTKNVEESDAKKLGEFLARDSFYFDGRPKSVQLDKNGDTSIFRAVVVEGAEKDTANYLPFTAMGMLLSSQVFNNKPVNVEMCNEKFKPLKVLRHKE